MVAPTINESRLISGSADVITQFKKDSELSARYTRGTREVVYLAGSTATGREPMFVCPHPFATYAPLGYGPCHHGLAYSWPPPLLPGAAWQPQGAAAGWAFQAQPSLAFATGAAAGAACV